MRIQHNITAMNAYRNYNTNSSALSKNLEKLSSGYQINRAGDDAAGLAISEKMRAQITGLEGAQKNANDGISLVQTAEGALTEVHDMLNRMYSLAEQSANGTYENGTDRVQLQKEVSQLKSEINRIADSSNFNGINLLDGSLGASEGATSVKLNGTDATLQNGATFSQTLQFGALADNTEYTMSFKYLDKDGNAQDATITFTGSTTAANNASNVVSALQSVFGDGYSVSVSGDTVTIAATKAGADKTQMLSSTFSLTETKSGTAATTMPTIGGVKAGTDATLTVSLNKAVNAAGILEIDGEKYQIVTRGETAESGNKALYVDKAADQTLDADSVKQIASQLKNYGVDVSANGTTLTFTKAGADATAKGGLSLQIGDTGDDFNQLTVTINDCHTAAMGIDGIDIGTQAGAKAALDQIKNAINYVSDVRGGLGATQNRLDHTINNLSVMQENIQDAESSIRDTDVASEMMEYTKNNILVQSAQAMLAQANQLPQGVLQLLQ